MRSGLACPSIAAPVVLVAAIFGFALPRVVSYRGVLTGVQVMTWRHVLLVVIAAGARTVSAGIWATGAACRTLSLSYCGCTYTENLASPAHTFIPDAVLAMTA